MATSATPIRTPPPPPPNILLAIKAREIILGTMSSVLLAKRATPIRICDSPTPPPRFLFAMKACEIILGTRTAVILRFSESYWQLVPHPLGPLPPPQYFFGDEILGDNLGNNEFSAIGNECHTHVVPQTGIDRPHMKRLKLV